MRRAGDVDRLQRLVAADAVIGMDDEIARRQRRRLGDELVEAAAAARRAREPVAEDVLLAEQHQVVGREALLERQHGEPDRRARQASRAPRPSATRRRSETPRSRSTVASRSAEPSLIGGDRGACRPDLRSASR